MRVVPPADGLAARPLTPGRGTGRRKPRGRVSDNLTPALTVAVPVRSGALRAVPRDRPHGLGAVENPEGGFPTAPSRTARASAAACLHTHGVRRGRAHGGRPRPSTDARPRLHRPLRPASFPWATCRHGRDRTAGVGGFKEIHPLVLRRQRATGPAPASTGAAWARSASDIRASMASFLPPCCGGGRPGTALWLAEAHKKARASQEVRATLRIDTA